MSVHLVRIFYIDVRAISSSEIPTYMESVSQLLESKGESIENFFIPIQSETRIEHIILDSDRVEISKVVSYGSIEELQKKYPNIKVPLF